MKKAVLIPISEPTDKVVPFLSNFKKEDFDYFLVVNDGSDKEKFGPIYDQIAQETVFEVIGYETNKGKGHALKYGMEYLFKKDDIDFVITADGDGQHTHPDILKVRDFTENNPNNLVLGSRILIYLASHVIVVLATNLQVNTSKYLQERN